MGDVPVFYIPFILFHPSRVLPTDRDIYESIYVFLGNSNCLQVPIERGSCSSQEACSLKSCWPFYLKELILKHGEIAKSRELVEPYVGPACWETVRRRRNPKEGVQMNPVESLTFRLG